MRASAIIFSYMSLNEEGSPIKKEILIRIFSRAPQLITDRLILRYMQPRDAEDMYEYACLPEVTRYLTWKEHPSLEYTKQYLSYIATRYKMGEFYDFSLICSESGRMIGTCGFTRFDLANDSAEIGYVLNPRYWHCGYATEAVTEILRYGFDSLGLFRIEARFMKDNLASRAVMERCGMTYEGIHRGLMLIKGKHEDIGICSITKEEYKMQHLL